MPMQWRGAERYGYEPVILPESGKLPLRDGEFEVVYCSSVIEHVTGFNKDETWQVSGPNFEARRRNSATVRERNPTYFEAVLCPDPGTQFPGRIPHVAAGRGWLSHPVQAKLISITNRRWVKKTRPDFRLLTVTDMQQLFPDCQIHLERSAGFVKSIMAVRTCDPPDFSMGEPSDQ